MESLALTAARDAAAKNMKSIVSIQTKSAGKRMLVRIVPVDEQSHPNQGAGFGPVRE